MNNLIKNISNKFIKLELKAKNSPRRPNQMIPNWGFNPQYRKPLPQLLQWDRSGQQDHIQPPLYWERELEGQFEEVIDSQEDQFFTHSDDEEGELILQGEQEEKEVPPDDQDIDSYCRQFVDFMQAQIHKKYDLRSSRTRTRGK